MTAIVLGVVGIVVLGAILFGGAAVYGRVQRKQGELRGTQQPVTDAAERREAADQELAKPLPPGPAALDRLSRSGPDR